MTPQVPVPDAPAIVDAAVAEIAETARVLKLLQEHSALSETRHLEILGRISECQSSLVKLSEGVAQLQGSLSTQQSMESPQLAQLLSQIAELRADLTGLRESVTAVSRNQSVEPVLETPATLPGTVLENQPDASRVDKKDGEKPAKPKRFVSDT
jgi:hypothetical protein